MQRATTPAGPDVSLAVSQLEAMTRGEARIAVDPATGLARFLGFGPEGLTLEAPDTRAQSAEARALAFLGTFGAAFGIVDAAAELELAESETSAQGTKLRFIQRHRGLRVVGGELRVYFAAAGDLSAVDSRFVAGLDVDPNPRWTPAAARALATRQSGGDLTLGPLVVYRTDSQEDGLGYESEFTLGAQRGERVLIESTGGHTIPAIDEDPTPQSRVETLTLQVGASEQTVFLQHSYTAPVVVCSAGHANNPVPAVARVNRVTANSFDIRLQNPGDLSAVREETVHCIVAEEGKHNIDGHRFEARQYTTSITDGKGHWTGTAQEYLQSYDQPAVFGQIIGMNDEQTAWSVFWNKGASRTAAPTSAALTTGRTVLEDTDSGRGTEIVAFMVFESGHGILGGVEFEVGVGPRTVSGEPNGAPFAYSFNTAFASAPSVNLNQMAGVVGGDGGWSQTFGATPVTATTLNLFIDEDQLTDAERSHDVERVAYAVFARNFAYPRVDRGPEPVPCDGRECGDPELKLETLVVAGVGGGFRTVAPLQHTYESPVIVCNAQYAHNVNPVVTRVHNVTASGFDLKLQNPSGDPVVAEDVHCIVVEEGIWQRDGVRFEAQKYPVQVTDRHTRWLGQRQTYGQAYADPVVVGQVMSFNDADFSVYWQKGTDRDTAPSPVALTNGMTVLQDSDVTRNREVIGFIVFEAGHGPFLGSAYEAATGAATVRGVHDRTPNIYPFRQSFTRSPALAVTSMAGAKGGDGGWSQLHGAAALSPAALNLSIDEDQIQDRERSHTDEQVSYLAFEENVTFPAPPAPTPTPRGGSLPPEPCEGNCHIR